jgi:hypothetical protein
MAVSFIFFEDTGVPGVMWYFNPHGILPPGAIFVWYIDPGINFSSRYFKPPHGKLTPLISIKRQGFIIPGIVTPCPWYCDPPTHGTLIPYPWYIEPPIHGILTPLSMVYWTLSYGIMNPCLLIEMRGVNFPWGGLKYRDEKLIPGSIYHTKIAPGNKTKAA